MPNQYDQRNSTGDPYGGYDDGLGAIGMAATSAHSPNNYAGAGSSYNAPVQAPQPQRLVSNNHASNLLARSPSPGSNVGNGYQQDDTHGYDGGSGAAGPPSYGVATGDAPYQARPEKSGYH